MIATLHNLVLQLMDPRGRSNRTDFLHVAIAMFGLQVLLFAVLFHVEEEFGRVTALPANLVFVYMAACAVTRRLHDLGRSAWWMPAATCIWAAAGFILALTLVLVLGPSRMQPGAPAFWVVFLALMLPPLLAALWLHVAEGEPHDNRFGPVPGRNSRFTPIDTAQARPAAGPTTPGQARRVAAHA